MASKPLRIGYVPEHFSTPLHFAQKHFGLDAELITFPSGTGHMITSLQFGEIDVGIGLTEGWVAGLGKEGQEGGYRLVGTYVETPLCKSYVLYKSPTEAHFDFVQAGLYPLAPNEKSRPSQISRMVKLESPGLDLVVMLWDSF